MKSALSRYSSFVAISHIVFALPFALVGYMLALMENRIAFSSLKLALIALSMFWARNAAMSFNRIVDARIDAMNPRTQKREIPSRLISQRNAILFCLINGFLFIVTAYFINRLCFLLSFAALFVILGYSYTKRINALCHFILGLGVAIAPTGAYIAVADRFSLTHLLFSVLVFFWVAGFDILYALQDEEFDRNHRLYSIPALWGYKKSARIARCCHMICLLVLFYIGWAMRQTTLFYWIGCGAFSAMMVMQHIKIRKGNIRRIDKQFLLFNGWASVIFCIFFFLNYVALYV